MIKVFITNGCLGCRKTIKFFKEHNIDYVRKDFSKTKLTQKELMDILSLTNDGFVDILSTRSKEYKSVGKKIDDLKINQLINLIINTPMIMSRPIVLQYDANNVPLRLLVGYDADDLEIFLRKNHKKEFVKNSVCGFEQICGTICGRACTKNEK